MSRYSFVLRRLVQTVVLLLGIVLLVMLLLSVTPGDPARAVAGPRASEAAVERIREDLALDDSIPSQYARYVGKVVQGDFGESNKTHQPVGELILDRMPVTMTLLAVGVLLSVIITVPLAAIAATRRDRSTDRGIRAACTFGVGMPVFWTGILLILLVAEPTGWFPVGGGFEGSALDKLNAVLLPGLALAIAVAPVLIYSLRSSMLKVLDADYVTSARAIGVSGIALFRRHVFRNAVVPTIALLAVQIGFLAFGAVVIENTFDLPGLGSSMVTAVQTRDIPVIQGITIVFALLVTLVHLAADLAISGIDPRIEVS